MASQAKGTWRSSVHPPEKGLVLRRGPLGLLLGAAYVALGTLVATFLGGLVGLQAPWWVWAILIALVGRLDRAVDQSKLANMFSTAGSELEELREEVSLLQDRLDEIEAGREEDGPDY